MFVAALGVIGFGIAYVSWAIRVRNQYDAAYAATQVGDSMAMVLRRFDPPTELESHQEGDDRFHCVAECTARFWYRKPLSFGGDPISVDFNEKQIVIGKYQWVSP